MVGRSKVEQPRNSVRFEAKSGALGLRLFETRGGAAVMKMKLPCLEPP
jgi:hypothetical protein